jgi:glycosyltransferase involved in cell wall biosynthesis
MPAVTVVIPAYNEAGAIGGVVTHVRTVLRQHGLDGEVLVVADGATDGTAAEAAAAGATVVEHPQNMGYGRSLKTGILAAQHDLIVITDADGTYPADRIPELVGLAARFHMVVGARTGAFYQGSFVKRLGRIVFRWLSEFATGTRIPDINSGLRVFRRQDIVPFFPIISAGFSFTTTCTLVYLLNDLFVKYVPIEYHRRHGRSKVRHIRDSLRALQIIVEAILRCNPIKIFLLLAAPYFIAGVALLLWGLIGTHGVVTMCGVTAICTGGLVLGLGFVSVALGARYRPVDPVQSLLLPGAPAERSDGQA